jgi:hypothetical protein
LQRAGGSVYKDPAEPLDEDLATRRMTEPSVPTGRCFLAYLTANDSRHYLADFLNFRHMARWRPGVERLAVYIAVSRVQPFSRVDRAAIDGLLSLAAACEWLDVRGVLWKGNVGRDFGSAEACLQAIGAEAQPDDYVMVRNRSSHGPREANWYRRYIDQYARFPNTGLVGSTINLRCHLPVDGPTAHVQTYAYLTQWRHLQPLASAFPAAGCVERRDVITRGELGLSRSMLERGLGLSSLHWPDEYFDAQRLNAEHLPQTDIKRGARDVPLRYKYRSYFWQPGDLPAQLAWYARLRAHTGQQPGSAVPQRVLDRYG